VPARINCSRRQDQAGGGGGKLDYQTFGANLAVFRIERPTDGFVDGNVFVQDGEQVNKGLELSVFGEPLPGLRLMAGGTRMDTELKNTQGGTADGNHAVGVLTFQLNASVDWDVPGWRAWRSMRACCAPAGSTPTRPIP